MNTTFPLSDQDFFSLTAMQLEEELFVDGVAFADSILDNMIDDGFSESLASPPRSPASSTDEVVDAHHDKKVKVSLKASRYRNRKRQELEALRNTVTALEARLVALQSRSLPSKEPSTSCPRIWESLAHFESEQRQEAEHTNKELREFVELHCQLAHKLQDVLKKMSEYVGHPEIESSLT